MPEISMVAATLFKWVAFGNCKIYEIVGFNANAADVYIQLFEIPPVTAATAVPNASVPAFKSLVAQGSTNSGYAAGNGFKYDFGTEGITLKELFVALSSTEPNYTAVGANAGLDITLLVDSIYIINGNEVIAGDLTTNQQTLQVWTEANGLLTKYRLLRVDVKNNDTVHTPAYLDVYATDAMGATDLKLAHVPIAVPAVGSLTTVVNLGIEGLSPFQQDANYTPHYGCSLKVTGSTNCNIRAIYR